jgi:hypothetical protein
MYVCIVGLIFYIEFFLAKNKFSPSQEQYTAMFQGTHDCPRKIKGKSSYYFINAHLLVHYLF